MIVSPSINLPTFGFAFCVGYSYFNASINTLTAVSLPKNLNCNSIFIELNIWRHYIFPIMDSNDNNERK